MRHLVSPFPPVGSVGDPARTTADARGNHGGVADPGGTRAQDSQRQYPGTDSQRDLLDARDTGGDHEAGQDLAGPPGKHSDGIKCQLPANKAVRSAERGS